MTRATWIGWCAAVALALGGLIILVFGSVGPVTAGWFAYAPYSANAPTISGAVLLSRTAILGLLVLVIGLVGLGFLVGLRAGRKRAAAGTPDQ